MIRIKLNSKNKSFHNYISYQHIKIDNSIRTIYIYCIRFIKVYISYKYMEYKKYLTIREAAYILGVTPLTLRNWDKNGKFKAQRHPMNNYRVYKSDDLIRIINDIEIGGSTSNALKRMRKISVKHLGDE